MSTSKKEGNEKKYAIEFVQSSSLKTESEESQLQFLDALEHSTVALRLAVAFINGANNGNEHFGIDDYLKVCDEKKGDLSNVSIDGDKKVKAIMLALRISLDALGEKPNGQEAIELCELIAYLAPDKPVPVSFLKKSTTKNLEEPLKLLELYAIIKLKPEDKSVRIDFPIQKALKLSFKNVEVATLERGLELVVKDELNSGNVYHAMSLWDHATEHETLMRAYNSLIGKLMNAFSQCFQNTHKIVEYGKKQIYAMEKHLGDNHEEILKLKSNLSKALHESGTTADRVEAERLLRECARVRRNRRSDLLPAQLITLFNEAQQIKASHGETRQALDMLKRILEQSQNEPGVKRSFILLTRGYIALFEYELAIKSAVESFREMAKTFVELDHSDPESLQFIQEFVAMMLKEDKCDVAMKVFEEFPTLLDILLSSYDEDTMGWYESIAHEAAARGNFIDSIRILEDAKKRRLEGHNEEILKLKSNGNAIEFVQSSSSLKTESEERQLQLLETLRYSTVATSLAVAYIKCSSSEGGDKKFGIEEYIKLSKQRREELTNLDLEEDPKARAMYLALQLSMDAIVRKESGGQRAKEICQLLAYLATDKSIPIELFIGEDATQKSKVEESLKLLALYGVCSIKQGHQTLTIDHPVQLLIKKMYLSSEKSTLERALKLLGQLDIEPTLLYHAKSVWNHCSKYPDLIKKYHKFVIKMLNVPSDDYDEVMKFAAEQMKFMGKLVNKNQDVIKIENAYMVALMHQRCGGLKPESLSLLRQTLNKDPLEETRFSCPLEDRFRAAIDICRQKKYRQALATLKDIYKECGDKPYLEKSLVLSIKGLIAILRFKLGETTNEDCVKSIKPLLVDIRASSQPDDVYSEYFKEETIDILVFGGEEDYALEIFEEQVQVKEAMYGRFHPPVVELRMQLAIIKRLHTRRQAKSDKFCPQRQI